MKKHVTILFLCLIWNTAFSQMDSIIVDGINRKYLVHLPTGYDGSIELPVVLGFHGGYGNASQFEEQSTLSEKADEANFIMIYPDGLGFLIAPNFHFWNAGICCGYPYVNDIDDVNFIRELIDQIALDFAVDLNRVYATGMSNGAFMSYRLACELSDKIAAIAPVAGGMILNECPSDRKVPIIHFHSYLDENIPYDGGTGDGASSHHNPPLDSVFNVWANKGDCDITNDTLHHDSDYTFVSWNGCECNSEINYYITTDGGHSWPGGNPGVIGDPVSEILNANDLMWDFFENHDLDCGPASINSEERLEFQIYPNPTKGSFDLKSENLIESIKLFNTIGEVVLSIKKINSDHIRIEPAGLTPGIYILQINSNGILQRKQLIIQ